MKWEKNGTNSNKTEQNETKWNIMKQKGTNQKKINDQFGTEENWHFRSEDIFTHFKVRIIESMFPGED